MLQVAPVDDALVQWRGYQPREAWGWVQAAGQRAMETLQADLAAWPEP